MVPEDDVAIEANVEEEEEEEEPSLAPESTVSEHNRATCSRMCLGYNFIVYHRSF